jgi:hypothetical protein
VDQIWESYGFLKGNPYSRLSSLDLVAGGEGRGDSQADRHVGGTIGWWISVSGDDDTSSP